MSTILDKLNSYEILTNLLPGVFFGLTLKFLLGLAVPTENIGEAIILYYFMGLIINRIGSLVVEPILIKFHFIEYTQYREFAKAVKKDPKIDVLLEINHYFRALLACSLLLPLIGIIRTLFHKWAWFSKTWHFFAILSLIVLFLLSYRKQTNYIKKRIESANLREIQEKIAEQ